MGVNGLWRLIEPSGKPVPLETLENKVLAVDISIWLHQAVKGFQDSKGASVPNAHLLGIYHRVCKLLFFKIKPVFVFDGGVPALKKQTIAKRSQSKLRNISAADRIQKQLLDTLLKHSAVSKVLTERIEASIGSVSKPVSSNKDDLFKLPPNEVGTITSSSEDESTSENTTSDSSPTKNWDLHTIDMESRHFKSLPVDVRHEILTDLKETRKQSSWGKLHELPKVSDDFSDYQMRRLLKRQAVQAALEEAEKEMGGKSLSLAELESILKDQGVITNLNIGNRIASDEDKKYLLVKDVQKAIEEVKKIQSHVPAENSEGNESPTQSDKKIKDLVGIDQSQDARTKADLEYEDDLKRAIALSMECEPSTSDTVEVTSKPIDQPAPTKSSFPENFTDADFVSSSSEEDERDIKEIKNKMSSAQSYMLEYSGLTPNEISKIISTKANARKLKLKKPNILTIPEISEDVTSTTDDKLEELPVTVGKISQNSDDNAVEIMSSSSDSDYEVKVGSKKIDVVINPELEFNEEEDLFADVFSSKVEVACDQTDNLFSDVNLFNDLSGTSGMKIILDDAQKPNKDDDIIHDVLKNNVNIEVDNANTSSTNSDLKEILSSNEIFSMVSKNEILSKKFTDVTDKGEAINHSKEILSSNETLPTVIGNGNLSNEVTNITNKEESVKEKSIERLNSMEVGKHTSTKKPSTSTGDNSKAREKPSLSEQELRDLKDQLTRDKISLVTEKSSKERIAGNITDQMYSEAQELLELFGVPYIIAPMEAEAQCAFLDAIDLTDGTITDDSDIWLFGGDTVYKNFFNQSKYVMEFKAESIKHHFKLTREQMILLALLVGSDYTVGLQGVGPVTAMEILAAFPPGKVTELKLSHKELLSGLKEFRSWFIKGKSAGPGRASLKSKLKNVTFTENFPSSQVVEAYLDPKVETSREAFSWTRPNDAALLVYAKDKFGWTSTKAEEILNPVLKKLDESKQQKSIRDYFKTRFRVHSIEAENKISKRVRSAITNMGRDPSEILSEELQEELKKQPKRKRKRSRNNEGNKAVEFTKSSKLSKADMKESKTIRVEANVQDELCIDTTEINSKKIKKKPQLERLHSTVDEVSSSSKMEESVKKETQDDSENNDVSRKISLIRKRRKIKEAKAAVEIKKPKTTKDKLVENIVEDIPDDLKEDEEVNLLSQVVSQSSKKVADIDKSMKDNFDKMEISPLEIFQPKESMPTPLSHPQASTSTRRPISRPTRVPRKEVIPQKEKDKSMLLRNKLKAIEIFRKGKQGPGYIPRRDRKKRTPKADADLSESSDE